MSQQVMTEAARRRTFAIISHPDAGKTTLTEKFLLYAGAITSGGSVKAHEGRRAATSDWMEMEQKRGISITSTALHFPYRDHELNLLDTPGHRDFSEDTYRVLSAVDAVVMVLDSAKGIEPQTLKLFEVCRSRNLPVITFLNKLDRPGHGAARAARPDREADRPATDSGHVAGRLHGDFRGVIDRRTGVFTRFTRTARGSADRTRGGRRPDPRRGARRARSGPRASTTPRCSTRSAPTSTCRRSSPASRPRCSPARR